MLDEAKESLQSALCLFEDQLQIKEENFSKQWVTVDALTHCFLCRGSTDEAISMLKTCLEQVEEKSATQKVYIRNLHLNLMKCHLMSGDLSTAIHHCEREIEMYDENSERNLELKRFKFLQDLHQYRDNNEHKQEGWKDKWMELHRNFQAPLRREYQQYKLKEDPFVDEFCKQVALLTLKDMNKSEVIGTDLALNLEILEKVEANIALVFDQNIHPEQNPGILLHQFYQIQGATQLRLGMFDEAKESLQSALCLFEDQLQFDEVDALKLYDIIGDLTDCFLCKGEPNDAIKMLEQYFKTVKVHRNLKNRRESCLSCIHYSLMECYTMEGDLQTAIEHLEMGIQVLDEDPADRDLTARSLVKHLQQLRDWQESSKHKEEGWKEYIVQRHRDEYAPLSLEYERFVMKILYTIYYHFINLI